MLLQHSDKLVAVGPAYDPDHLCAPAVKAGSIGFQGHLSDAWNAELTVRSESRRAGSIRPRLAHACVRSAFAWRT